MTEDLEWMDPISLNPEKIDHFVTAYGGGLTRDVLDGINYVYTGVKDEEFVSPENYPLKKIFVKTAKGWDKSSIFYEFYEGSEITPYTDQEIHRFYRSGATAVRKGLMKLKTYNKKVKEFRRNQKDLTGKNIPKNPYKPKEGSLENKKPKTTKTKKEGWQYRY